MMYSFVPQLLEIAQQAGEAILNVYTSYCEGLLDARLDNKADQSPLTIADLLSHEVIVEGLERLKESFPIVSEEDASSLCCRTADGGYWLIDPLDGTKEFLSKSGEFTVNIALIESGSVVWGVVYAPVPDLLYWGGNGLGAYRRNGVIVNELSVHKASAKRRVVMSKSHCNEDTREYLNRLGDVEMVQAGSSLKFCRVAEGAADIYPRLGPTCEWDTGAAQAVLEGAGGYVVDLNGNRLRYGKPSVLNPSFVALSDLELLAR